MLTSLKDRVRPWMKQDFARCRTRVPDGGVALTFDDGPDPVSTPRILDILAAHEAPATFFVVGDSATAHPELLERMVAEGHAVGSHSMTHPEARELGLLALRREYRGGRGVVERVLGRPAPLFRPPKGHVGADGAVVMRTLGLEPWMWSIDPFDYEPAITTQQLLDRVPAIAPGDVFLLHDASREPDPRARPRTATIEALPELIGRVRAAGLTLTTLPTGSARL